ncbi:unnamed protein product [Porites lobata]|uniref:Uncharacterized protein n=1 Tax=Porites lobata TaxID=104759 RepID=A0ABN8NKI1_9CNID|nr:unnamed protein product [Porites lobata]
MVFETCGPNEAMVVSGVCHTKPALVSGGRIFVWPWIQKLQKISLNTMTLNVESPCIYPPWSAYLCNWNSSGKNSRPKSGNVVCSLPTVSRQITGGSAFCCLGNTGGPSESHHGHNDC